MRKIQKLQKKKSPSLFYISISLKWRPEREGKEKRLYKRQKADAALICL